MRKSMIVSVVLAAGWLAGGPSFAVELTQAQMKAVRQAVRAHVQRQLEEGDGAVAVRDEKLDKEWRLKLTRLHDEVRQLSDRLFSVRADFKAVDEGTKLEVDFLLNGAGTVWEVREAVIRSVGGKPRGAQASAAAPLKRLETSAGVFVCPMGEYSGPRTKDGRCPKCGMNLVEKK